MASEVDIANRALTKLGSARILSLTDDSKQARALNSMFAIVRDAELRAKAWNFATKRAALASLTSTPAFGFNLEFQLPADHLRLLEVGDYWVGWSDDLFRTFYPWVTAPLYQLEGRKILTDLSAPLNIRYTAQITDPQQFDALFVESLACKLAMELAEDLTQSAGKRDRAAAEYRAAMEAAGRGDAFENPPKQMAESSWLTARR